MSCYLRTDNLNSVGLQDLKVFEGGHTPNPCEKFCDLISVFFFVEHCLFLLKLSA